jgi:hypothetical protein
MQARLNRTGSVLDILQIWHAAFAKRGGNTDYRRMTFRDQVKIRTGVEITGCCQASDTGRVNMSYVTSPVTEFLYLAIVDIETYHLESCLGETAGKWQTGITEAEYCYSGAPGLELFSRFFEQLHLLLQEIGEEIRVWNHSWEPQTPGVPNLCGTRGAAGSKLGLLGC